MKQYRWPPRSAADVRRNPRAAAGLLLRHTDAEGVWYLLGHRHAWLGGTWANIGGSLEPGEHPLAAALREFSEELSIGAQGLLGATIAQVIDCGTEERPYTLFVVDVPTFFDDVELSWENVDVAWFPPSEIDDLEARHRLHRGFSRAWKEVADV